jgi:transposase
MTHSALDARPARPAAVVTGGVDTHKDTHTAAVLDATGRLLGHRQFPTTPAGYGLLLAWLRSHGELDKVGIEGTGAYGAGLALHLRVAGVELVEVDRPDRKARRQQGKSDPVDAEAAARAVQAGEVTIVPKAADGHVEMLRSLRVARTTAMRARTQAVNALRSLLVTAPAELREQLRGRSAVRLVGVAATLDPGRLTSPTAAAMLALRTLARRYQALDAEVTALDSELDRLTATVAPRLLALFGVGADVASALLIAAGDNPRRLRSEAAFSMLCGSSPIEASSGKTTRHRLNRGGDRQANAALYRTVIVRLRWHQPTKDYVARRTAEGKSKKEIIRCLKRYVAREVFAALREMNQADPATAA